MVNLAVYLNDERQSSVCASVRSWSVSVPATATVIVVGTHATKVKEVLKKHPGQVVAAVCRLVGKARQGKKPVGVAVDSVTAGQYGLSKLIQRVSEELSQPRYAMEVPKRTAVVWQAVKVGVE